MKEPFVLWPGPKTVSLIGATSLVAVFLAIAPVDLLVQERLIIGTLATLQTVFLVWLMSTQRDRLKRFSIKNVVVFTLSLALIGATRGFLIHQTLLLFSDESQVLLETRIFNSVVTICAWGLVFSVLEARLMSYKEEYRRLFAASAMRVALVQRLSPSELAKDIDELESLRSLQANLGKIAQEIDDGKVLPSQLLAASAKIRNEIEQSLRPLSQRMWFDSNEAEPKFRIWELLKEALRNLNFPWDRTAALNTLAFLLGSLSIFGIQETVVRCAVFGVTLSALLVTVSKLSGKVPYSAAIGAIMLVLTGLVSHVAGELAVAMFVGNNLSGFNPYVLAISIATIGALIAEAMLIQMRNDWSLVNISISDRYSRIGQNALEKRLAGFLHNSIKSQLEGIAIGLEKASESETKGIGSLLERLRSISNSSLGSQFAAVSGGAFVRLNRIVDSWQGISEIHLEFPHVLESHPKLELATEFLEEAISNAVRHSNAESIYINLNQDGDDIVAEVIHSSTTKGRAKAQIGQLWLQRFSKDYSLTHTRGGERILRVTI